jgi:hypothetical protein
MNVPALSRRDLGWAAVLSVFVLLLNAGYVVAHLGPLHKPKRVGETDHLRYIEMAKGEVARPELARDDPFCWRVAVPALAGALARAWGGDLNLAFYAVTNVSLFFFLGTLFLYLRQLGFSPGLSAHGVILAGLVQGAVRWYEYQYWMTDPTCLFLVTLGLLLVERGHFGALVAVCALGAFVRETSVLVLPYYFFHAARRTSWRLALARTAALAALPALVLIGLRAAIVPVAANPLSRVLVDALSFRARHFFDNQAYLLTVGTWGALLPLALLRPRRALSALPCHLEHVALVAVAYFSLAVANNTERLLAYALPSMLAAALAQARTFLDETRLPPAALFLPALALQIVLWLETRLFAGGISLYQPTSLAVVGGAVSFWMAAQVVRARRERPA